MHIHSIEIDKLFYRIYYIIETKPNVFRKYCRMVRHTRHHVNTPLTNHEEIERLRVAFAIENKRTNRLYLSWNCVDANPEVKFNWK